MKHKEILLKIGKLHDNHFSTYDTISNRQCNIFIHSTWVRKLDMSHFCKPFNSYQYSHKTYCIFCFSEVLLARNLDTKVLNISYEKVFILMLKQRKCKEVLSKVVYYAQELKSKFWRRKNMPKADISSKN
jgi:hypothetical protein